MIQNNPLFRGCHLFWISRFMLSLHSVFVLVRAPKSKSQTQIRADMSKSGNDWTNVRQKSEGWKNLACKCAKSKRGYTHHPHPITMWGKDYFPPRWIQDMSKALPRVLHWTWVQPQPLLPFVTSFSLMQRHVHLSHWPLVTCPCSDAKEAEKKDSGPLRSLAGLHSK